MINDELLEDAQQEIYEKLCSNSSLLKIYSKVEIMKRIKRYIKIIRTNEVSYDCGGWCEIDTPEIVLCSSEEEQKPLTIEDIINNPSKLETLIHEAIHAVLKNKKGTGLYQRNDRTHNPKDRIAGILGKKRLTNFEEIGRGINEGYTNWIVEKCNMRTTTYELLTSLNRQIEICLDEDKMAKFAKGNFSQIFKALNMEEAYGIEFFRQLDEIYYEERKIGDINRVANYIKTKIDFLQKETKLTEEEKKREEKSRKSAISTKLYRKIFSEDIERKLLELDLREDTGKEVQEERIKLYESLLSIVTTNYKEPEMKSLKSLIGLAEEKIINSLVVGRLDSPSSISDFKRVMQLMKEIQHSLNLYEATCPKLDYLRQIVQEKSKGALNNIYSEIDGLIASGDFTGEMLKAEYDKVCGLFGDEDWWQKFSRSSEYAKLVSMKSEYPEENFLLIRYVLESEDIDSIDNLSVQRTSSNKGIIFENGKVKAIIQRDKKFYTRENDTTMHEDETFSDKIDWTIDQRTDLQMVIRKFEELKAAKLSQNPNVQIQIMDETIIFTDGENYEFYDILGGEESTIKKAEISTPEPVKPMTNTHHKVRNAELIPLVAQNDVITRMKRRIHKIITALKDKPDETDKGIIIQGKESKNEKSKTENKAFIKSLSFEQKKNLKSNRTKEDYKRDFESNEK